MKESKTFFFIAGEASGDLLGARLIHGLRAQQSKSVSLTITGIGGPEMERAGDFQSLFPMSELSYMGIWEILPHIPHLLRRIRQTTKHILELKPDILITLDAPEFSLRVAKKIAQHPSKIKKIHCVAPSVWVWRSGRAKKIAGFLDHLLALFPFEPPYFEKEGLPCTFVGHPLVEQPKGSAARFYEKFPSLDPNLPLLCLLPGSRHGEVSRLLPIFAKTIPEIRKTVPHLNIVLPTVPTVEPFVREGLSLFEPPAPRLIPEMVDRFDAFAAADVALAASGTVALELAFHETPMVIAYQASWLTEMILKRMVLVPHVCLVNLILKEALIPECLQKECTPGKLAFEVARLLTLPSALRKQKKGLQKATQALYADQPFSQKAAHLILNLSKNSKMDNESEIL